MIAEVPAITLLIAEPVAAPPVANLLIAGPAAAPPVVDTRSEVEEDSSATTESDDDQMEIDIASTLGARRASATNPTATEARLQVRDQPPMSASMLTIILLTFVLNFNTMQLVLAAALKRREDAERNEKAATKKAEAAENAVQLLLQESTKTKTEFATLKAANRANEKHLADKLKQQEDEMLEKETATIETAKRAAIANGAKTTKQGDGAQKKKAPNNKKDAAKVSSVCFFTLTSNCCVSYDFCSFLFYF